MSKSQRTSSNNNKHPYLVHSKYEDLFGHLYRETSTPEWKKRMDDQRAIVAKNVMNDGISLTRMSK